MRAYELLKEAAAAAKTAVRYPRGLAGKITTPDTPHRQFASAPQFRITPVLLLHGLMQNSSSMEAVQHHLTCEGFECFPMNYQTIGIGVQHAARKLATTIDQVTAATGTTKLHIVAHSMGGLVTRVALDDPDVAQHVGTVVTLGSPHGGTPLANAFAHVPVLSAIAKDFMPGSDVLRQIAAIPKNHGVRWVSIYSVDDHIVPGQSGRLDSPAYDAINVELTGVGHAGLLNDPTPLDMVRDHLLVAETYTQAA